LIVVGGAMGIAAVVQDDQLETEALEQGCNVARGYCPDEDLGADYASRADSIQATGWAATAFLATGATLMLIAPLLPRDEIAAPAAGASTDGVWVGVRGRF
jgi:hypothetical protein